MHPLWQLSGLQTGGIWFESWPEIGMVFGLARCNGLVRKLAETASFHIHTCTPFICIFFSIWWYMIIFCASEAAGKLACCFYVHASSNDVSTFDG